MPILEYSGIETFTTFQGIRCANLFSKLKLNVVYQWQHLSTAAHWYSCLLDLESKHCADGKVRLI